MRILFQYFIGGGGALTNVLLLLKAYLREYPHDHLDIVCSQSSQLYELQEYHNVNIISYGGTKHQEISRLMLGFGGLNRIACERKADLIWSLNLGSYVKSNIPQILSVHNSHQVYPWGITRYHPGNSLHVAMLRWFFRKSLRISSGVMVQTPIIGKYISQIKGSPSRIEVIPKAVESEVDLLSEELPDPILEKLNSGLGRNAFTFLYVATSVPHKNHITLINAFDILASEAVPSRVVLSITIDELKSIGGAKAEALVQSGHIVPVGWVSKSHLEALYNSSDGCLMPSVLESLSSAHLEAMAWNKPQIVANLRYALDLCGDAAMYVSAEDHAEWANAIKIFIKDAELRENLILKGRERMQAFPATWGDVAKKIHAFFEETIIVNQNSLLAR